jgi:hypothetical protein
MKHFAVREDKSLKRVQQEKYLAKVTFIYISKQNKNWNLKPE